MTNDILLHASTALLLGLGSSAHCVGMCGGIACALGLQTHKTPGTALALYNIGRVLAYAMIALLLGGFLQQLLHRVPALTLGLRTIAGLLLIAMALHTLQVWKGILLLEKLGRLLWMPLQKIGRFLLPVRHYWQLLLLGFLWGWLPCALVYSTLGWAVTQGGALEAALLMFIFGVGTTPVMLINGIAAQKLQRSMKNPAWRYSLATLLLLCAAWTFHGTWQHAQHNNNRHTDHSHHQKH